MNAISSKNVALVKVILSRIVLTDPPAEDGAYFSDLAYLHSPLSYAAQNCNVEIVELLLNANTNASYISPAGLTTLLSAVQQCGQFPDDAEKIVQLLLKGGTNVNYALPKNFQESFDDDPQRDFHRGWIPGDTALDIAAKHGCFSIFQHLLAAGAQLTDRILYCATLGESTTLVKQISDYGVNPNHRGYKEYDALRVASCAGNLEIVELLLNRGAQIDFSQCEDEDEGSLSEHPLL